MQITNHEAQYQYNEEVIDYCQKCNFPYQDWMITITFYTALHKIDSILHKLGYLDCELSKHEKRNQIVSKDLPAISYKYNQLYIKCRRLRYEQQNINSIPPDELEKYLNIWFNIIKPYTPKKLKVSSA